jgi:hypothetical protein
MQTPVSRADVLAPAPPEMRPLSTTEKTALAKALSKTVPHPNAAQFSRPLKIVAIALVGSPRHVNMPAGGIYRRQPRRVFVSTLVTIPEGILVEVKLF